MKTTSKKSARPIARTPQEDADPLGFAAKLEEAYHAQLRAILRRNLLVRFEPAVLRGIGDGGTNHGGPVSFPATLTVYPRDAHGFARVVGELETPVAELTAETEPDEQPDDPEGVYITSMFTGKPVWVARPKRGWRGRGPRR